MELTVSTAAHDTMAHRGVGAAAGVVGKLRGNLGGPSWPPFY